MFNQSAKNLNVQLVQGKQSFIVQEDIVYTCPRTNLRIKVDAGFHTDLASIPAIARVIVSNDDWRIRLPAIVHDWIYRHSGKLYGFEYNRRFQIGVILPRSRADEIFYLALREQGVSWLKARMMWLGVRAGGWASWK